MSKRSTEKKTRKKTEYCLNICNTYCIDISKICDESNNTVLCAPFTSVVVFSFTDKMNAHNCTDWFIEISIEFSAFYTDTHTCHIPRNSPFIYYYHIRTIYSQYNLLHRERKETQSRWKKSNDMKLAVRKNKTTNNPMDSTIFNGVNRCIRVKCTNRNIEWK